MAITKRKITKATKKKVTKKKAIRRSTSHSAESLFPASMVITWPNGDTEMLYFASPAPSRSGNLNAWAGDKLVRDGNILRINCNVTRSRG